MCLRLNVNEIFITLAREFQSNSQVILQDIVLLEFKCTVYIQSHACQVFIGPWAYGIILGQDFLQKIRFHINLDNNTMNYLDKSVLLWSPDYFSDCTCLFNIMFSDNVEVDSFCLSQYKFHLSPSFYLYFCRYAETSFTQGQKNT